jgi:hypothetical protein
MPSGTRAAHPRRISSTQRRRPACLAPS